MGCIRKCRPLIGHMVHLQGLLKGIISAFVRSKDRIVIAPPEIYRRIIVVHGMIPGPTLFEEQGNILYAIMLGLIVVNVFMYILGSGFTRFYAHITRIPYEILAAIVLTFCIAGAYSTNNRMYDIYIILIFGIVAYFLRRMDFQLVPILLGILLGPLAEKNFRRALVLSDGSLDIFFTRPISCAFILIAVGSILLFAWKNHKAKVKNTQK